MMKERMEDKRGGRRSEEEGEREKRKYKEEE